ncbi:energy-coupling factor ABC transporter substrate-binding protein [Domibacillus epiphyticus]|uniref:Cobalt transport protein CbiN n=1 Tax=Domibacillus epiphyticus TaxID=1714355 RepID=A0A1V2A6X3_9BACI|nr:energy-coupling factor ABC transporter substrate-binding protein [Domibacillus epiphyticus]OMP66738.1 cobalt ABC transporter substrate-binding protein CbiN [Domibacillus epiphyticus]
MKNLALVLFAVAIAVIPLFMWQDSEFGGADGQAEELITAIQSDYEPWANPLFEPPGGETESLLFSLQAAIGAGVIGYVIGTVRARAKREKL